MVDLPHRPSLRLLQILRLHVHCRLLLYTLQLRNQLVRHLSLLLLVPHILYLLQLLVRLLHLHVVQRLRFDQIVERVLRLLAHLPHLRLQCLPLLANNFCFCFLAFLLVAFHRDVCLHVPTHIVVREERVALQVIRDLPVQEVLYRLPVAYPVRKALIPHSLWHCQALGLALLRHQRLVGGLHPLRHGLDLPARRELEGLH